DFLFEIDLHGALTVLAFATVPLAVHEVSAVAIDLTHGGLQVVHIAVHLAVDRIFCAIFTSTVLPALALVAKLPGRNNVLPAYSAGAILVLADLIAAGSTIHDPLLTLPGHCTAAVESTRSVGINLYIRCFCMRETVNAVGKSKAGEGCRQKSDRERNITGHPILRVKTSPHRNECCSRMQSV